MGQGHSHVPPQGGNERALKIALALTSTFLIAEAVAAIPMWLDALSSTLTR